MEPSATHGLWADLHRPDSIPEQTTFSVIGIPYDGAVCARTGAAGAPGRIRFWSQHLTPVSEDRTRLASLSICDLGDIQINEQAADFEKIRHMVAGLPNIPILLGGDHSVTIPVLQGQRQRFAGRRLGVLWMDAHPDLCNEFTGSRLSHACVLRRGLESGIAEEDVCLVGLRSWEVQELDFIDNSRLNIYPITQVDERGVQAISTEVRQVFSTCDAVHISLDIDCLDPAHAPGTGIPDAGGLTMRELLVLLKSLQGLPLVGLDVVEVAPALDPSEATVFAALKFIMEFMAVIARGKQE